MANRLTHKERGFVRDYVAGETGVQAVLNNYDTKNYATAGVMATENLKKPRIIQAIEEALPDELLDKIHREGLFATKGIYNDKGERIDEDADFNIRAKYLDMAYKRKGKYAADKHINVNVEVEATKEVNGAAKILDEYVRKHGTLPEGDSLTSHGDESRPLGTEAQTEDGKGIAD